MLNGHGVKCSSSTWIPLIKSGSSCHFKFGYAGQGGDIAGSDKLGNIIFTCKNMSKLTKVGPGVDANVALFLCLPASLWKYDRLSEWTLKVPLTSYNGSVDEQKWICTRNN